MVAVRQDYSAERVEAEVLEMETERDRKLADWMALGRRLLERGGGRLEIASRASVFGALGGEGIVFKHDDANPLTTDEEDDLVRSIGDATDEAHRRGGLDALQAIWLLCCDDNFPETSDCISSEMGDIGSPWDGVCVEQAKPDYPTAFRRAVEHYTRVLVAGATASQSERLRDVYLSKVYELDVFGPCQYIRDPDVEPVGRLDHAIAKLVVARSNGEVAAAVGDFGYASTQKLIATRFPPGYRLGLIRWFAYRGLKKPRVRRVQEAQVSP